MIIDCHQHTDWHGKTTADFIQYFDSAGVDRAWLLSWEEIDGGRDPGYMHLSIDNVFATAAAHPSRYVIGTAPDPRRENVLELIRRYRREGAKIFGEVKLCVLMDTPELIAAFRLAGELGMPVLFHLQLPNPKDPDVRRDRGPGQWYLGDIDAVERTLTQCPGTVFLGHGPGWWAHISADEKGYGVPKPDAAGLGGPYASVYPDGPVVPGGGVVRLLEKYPNIYCDLSAWSGLNGISRDREFGRRFLIDYADRLLYGTDYWDTKLLDYLRGLELPPAVLEKILSGNAIRLEPK